jgi:phenylpropionate dioxygenase-like ring-hydroxylating dioxygenase large terminal subunit
LPARACSASDGRDGVIRAFYNVCQHRAHELVSGEGNCKVVVCPYHAWSYELSGELRSGPNIKVVPGFDKREICLSEVRIENFHGFLFANLDPDAKPMDDWFPDGSRAAGQTSCRTSQT